MLRFGCYLLVVITFLAIQIEGSCLRGRLKPSPSPTIDASGNNVTEYHCEYLNVTYELNANWSYPYPSCLNCSCIVGVGLVCCGYGISAGVIEPPEGCQLANGTCEVILVKKSDPSQPCFDTEPSTSTQTTTEATTKTTTETTTETTTITATTKKRCGIRNKVLEMFHATNDVDVEIHCVCQKINKL